MQCKWTEQKSLLEWFDDSLKNWNMCTYIDELDGKTNITI